MLALDQLGGDEIKFPAEQRIAGIDPSQRGGVQPFADVFPVPGLPARTLAKTFQQAIHIQHGQAI
jgi:hypothetical protein